MRRGVNGYLSSIVLGLNDALVELTGVLVGLTLAFANSRIVLFSGFITGFAASLSMAASEYLSSKQEILEHPTKHKGMKHPLAASIYTGIAYFATVLFLLIPYMFLANVFYALYWSLGHAIIVVLLFTGYSSYVSRRSFFCSFTEMFLISSSVAILSFLLGYFLRVYVGVEV